MGGEAVREIVRLLEDLSSRKRDKRAEAAERLGDVRAEVLIDRLADLLADEYVSVRMAASRALAQIGEPAVPAVLRIVETRPKYAIRQAVYTLAEIGQPAVRHIQETFRHSNNEEARFWLLRALEGIYDPSAAPLLVEALSDTQRIHVLSAEILHRMGNAAAPALVRGLSHPHPRVRSRCIDLLSRSGYPEAAPAVMRLLDDSDENVQIELLRALGVLQSQEAQEILLEYTQYDNANLRCAALVGLSRYPGPQPIYALCRAVEHDPDDWIREEALWLLTESEILSREALPPPEAMPTLAAVVTGALGRLVYLEPALEALRRSVAVAWQDPGPAAEAALLMIRYHDSMIQSVGIDIAETAGDPAAIPALIQALSDTGEISHTRIDASGNHLSTEETTIAELAARALRAIGTPEALDAVNAWERTTRDAR